jgi:ATP-grasp domain/L-amino acid ligase C-terminal domain 2
VAHLLIMELPGGNDTDLLEAATRQGHTFVFLTQNRSVYEADAEVYSWVSRATEILEFPSFELLEISDKVSKIHEQSPFDALLCLIDIRLIEAAELAQILELRFIRPEVARLLRDKYSVRECLQKNGITQPPFQLITNNDQILSAIQTLGLPILIKPCDGYGSQNIMTLKNQSELEVCQEMLTHLLPISSDYGLGVRSNDRLLLERYMQGRLIGCDTLSIDGMHHLLGVNEKMMFAPPSFAIRGGCFVPNKGDWPGLEKYLFAMLDAVQFEWGAAHIEVMVTDEGPRLIEINPRLVGAKIARLMSCALDFSVHELLIDVHLGFWPANGLNKAHFKPAVTRWVVAQQEGILDKVVVPQVLHPAVKHFEILIREGARVSPPFENVHRLGYVMTCDENREIAEQVAQDFVNQSKIYLK